ncbi:unnamed protein product [Gongylonema pulchrum]|uniref:Uncharacterized protein n=1 Tax=Gongylonema pulchrum TaxID=637853 RepID=A0A183EFW7_9BILA|nr:unnamed protein product [Gongylonema pulchrum]
MAADYIWSWRDYVFYGMCSCGNSATDFDSANHQETAKSGLGGWTLVLVLSKPETRRLSVKFAMHISGSKENIDISTFGSAINNYYYIS